MMHSSATRRLSPAGRGDSGDGFTRRFKIAGTYRNGRLCQQAADAEWPGCRANLTLVQWPGKTIYLAVPEAVGVGNHVPLAYRGQKRYYVVDRV
jgi:hypothetical protein